MNNEFILILDNIRSVENVGSIFRTAECFGVSKIVLVGITPAPVDRFGRKRTDFSKVSLGSEKLVSYEACKSISPKLEELKKEGYKIIALEQHPLSTKLSNFPTSKLKNFALVVGNEVEGVSKEALELADDIVEISMMGMKESLNVSVATGVALYHLLK
ncbi:MAG: TrmH family RNA methyltransferase [Candidatus Zambryskibacteria bacterium]|nr:TrmH family RNA methyltransferase [Candidatus Zambryskibacteria bacterium]